MSKKLVSIIIVSAGRKDCLSNCLESIKAQTCQESETIVIDNSARNIFYCGALNEGIAKSKGDFVLCLNDDVILDKKFIEEALKGFDIDEKMGMVSGKILRSDKITIDSTGLFLSVWRTAKERGYNKKDRGRFEKEGDIFGVNGAVAFYRREMLKDIKDRWGYFDSRFRMFYEDLDVAWRGRNKGWKAYYMPKAVAYHIRGASARTALGINKRSARRFLSDELHVDLIKNRYLAIVKNETIAGFLLHLPFIAIYDAAVWGYILLFKFGVVKRLLKYFLVGH